MRFLLALATLLLAPAFPLAAQDDADDIVVVGEREVTVRQLRGQARSITPRDGGHGGEPMARFHDPLCAGVWGMSAQSAQLVIDRIYHNAEQIGLPVVREAGCDPNVIVAIAEDSEAEFQAMRDERHPLVRGLDYWDRKRVVRQEDWPVLAWNVVSPYTAYGAIPLGDPPIAETTQMSRTVTSTTNRILISIIMVDRAAVAGLDAVSLADYATMRALARTRAPVEDTAVGTILSLFDESGDAPDRLSPFDRAYLTGLYDSPDNRPMRMTMGTIGSRLRQELVDGE